MQDEVRAFFDVHEQEGSHAGGVHLEMTVSQIAHGLGMYVTFCEMSLYIRKLVRKVQLGERTT
jgi:3-deoxy-D-arabino-heptulosonate 7-phosphate (DAHP) synthase class II